jgi:multiple antibiotic resistance protein
MNFFPIIETTAYFLALINPPSKILVLATHQPPFTQKELFSISLRSTIAALTILAILTSIGSFLLVQLFHVEIYSLNVAGGIVIFLVGLSAVQKGRFFYEDVNLAQGSDISIVPLAAPLIAGPGIISAAISSSSSSGLSLTLFCLIIALSINFVLMLFSLYIGRGMEKAHMTGPMIRITGLIVLSVAVQMIFSGFGTWLNKILAA